MIGIPRSVRLAELAERFRAVLGDNATFDAAIDDPDAGAAISGTLTASGVTGGFDLRIIPAGRPEGPSCDDPEAQCTLSHPADGSTLAISRVSLMGSPGGISYEAHLARADGFEIRMYVSNQRSPKGASELLAPDPPLTTDQMAAIVTSDRW